jgi:LDH2 family malate/lactate/ureidoglycolate dehydrogenase
MRLKIDKKEIVMNHQKSNGNHKTKKGKSGGHPVKEVRLPVARLQRFVSDVFKGLGVPPGEAAICADVLMEADLQGIDSHGVNRCKPIYYNRIRAGTQNAVTRIKVLKEGPTTAVLDGHNGMGQVVAHRAMSMAIAKARKNGLGMVVVRRSTHYGIAGYWAQMAVDAGMIGMTGTNARPSTAPTFGVENMLGTNPLTFALPTDEPFPFMIDCATSVTQRGKIEYYDRMGRDLPEGWVIDSQGRPLTDARGVLKALTSGGASLLPLGGAGEEGGGYKGYGYATLVEILAAALSNGAFLKALSGVRNGKPAPIELGHFFLAINIKAFIGLKVFKRTAGTILRQLRASRKAPGCRHIYTAGEKEYLAKQKRCVQGIALPVGVQQDMTAMRDELGLTQYRFPWDQKSLFRAKP